MRSKTVKTRITYTHTHLREKIIWKHEDNDNDNDDELKETLSRFSFFLWIQWFYFGMCCVSFSSTLNLYFWHYSHFESIHSYIHCMTEGISWRGSKQKSINKNWKILINIFFCVKFVQNKEKETEIHWIYTEQAKIHSYTAYKLLFSVVVGGVFECYMYICEWFRANFARNRIWERI